MALAPAPQQLVQKQIIVGQVAVRVEVVDTESLREQGLSGRPNLPEGRGMLFVFDADGQWGIWMKDMQFPIDIIFADAGGVVTTIYRSVSPDTYLQNPPQIFYPTAPARYVVELPAGFTAAHNIAVGSKVVL